MSSQSTRGDFLERIQKLSPQRLALLAAELERRLAARESAAEPIAIIGVGCRMPGGVESPDALWDLMARGIDAIEEVPPSRWDAEAFYDPRIDTPGKSNTKWGGFASHIDQLDAAFFGISPREAVGMDPQQRMLLEVGWEALENACVRTDSLEGSAMGVFVGISTNDYGALVNMGHERTFDAYTGSGSARSVAAGRLSYLLGLKGPNLAIDTACSSSAVAIHLACQSLRQKECNLALAGGVNVILMPQVAIVLSQAHMMSGDGRCKAFSQAADGFVRSEGCGILVLKRLADARVDGDRIVGVIRGSAVNHDGRSSGLSAPNGPAQEAVVQAALAQAGLTPGDVDYIEAHGTGTVLGDAIELGALGAVFGAGRSAGNRLTIGSVKTNIGHLEAAAGSAGIIKVLLAMQYEQIPAHLHLSEGHENEALQRLPLRVPLRATPWPATKRPRIAGVSSFGFSGTNAHIIVEEPPQPLREKRESSTAEIIALSAKTAAALSALCTRYAQWLRVHPETSIADVAFTLSTGRTHFQHRIAFMARSAEEAADHLQQIADAKVESQPSYRFLAGYRSPSVGFLFTGQGSQYAAMGRDLYAQSTVFRDAVDRCDKILMGKLAHRLSAVIFGDQSVPVDLIHDTTWTQPVLFAFEYALATLWSSWGVRPSVVLGHSLGEYVAACIAGVFPLDSALELAYERGRLMGSLPRSGGMLAVRAGEEDIEPIIRHLHRLSIAAVNSSRSVVVSGDSEQIEELRALLGARGIVSQPLAVSHAFHSALMEPILDEFEAQAATLTFGEPQIPLASNVSGHLHSDSQHINASYWRKHLRGTVRFAEGLASLIDRQPDALLEVGPDPVLLTMAKPALAQAAVPGFASLRRGKEAMPSMFEALRQLYLLGVAIDWDQVYRDRPAQKLALPTYPFQRQRYWIATPPDTAVRVSSPSAPVQAFDRLLYTTVWQLHEQPLQDGQLPAAPSVLLVNSTGHSDLIYEALASEGIAVNKLNDATLLRQRLSGDAKPSSIVLELVEVQSEADIPEATLKNAAALLDGMKAIVEESSKPVPVWIVTRGATPTHSGDMINLSSAIADAIAKTVRLEHPELEIRCVDLPSQPTEKDLARLAQLIREGTKEQSVAIREGALTVPRLVPLNSVFCGDRESVNLSPDAAYLVTGAYGGLGFRTVQWMVDRGAACIVMAGRREPSSEIRSQIAALRQRGIQIHDVIGDVSVRDSLEAVFNRIAETKLPLRGIIHTAGVIDDGTLLQQTPDRFAKVFAPKVQGGWLLHELSLNHSLDFFVLFGSAAATLGSPGQANYAAANAFLDALAHFRRQKGLPSITIAWGAWSEIGMATRVKDTGRALRLGVSALSPDKGIELLEQAISSNQTEVAALPIDWRTYLAPGQPQCDWPFLEKLSNGEQRVEPPHARPAVLKSLLAAASAEHRVSVIRDYLRLRIVDVLRLDPGFVLLNDQPLPELGLDSLMALELKNELQSSLEESLPANFFFEYPTLDLAATWLNARMAVARNPKSAESGSSQYEELAI